MSRPVAALLSLAVLALGSCGGDESDPEQVVRDFVKATNERDSDKLCDELLSAEFIAQSTGAEEGDTQACKEQLEAVTGLRLTLVEVRGTEVDGDDATVTAILRVQGQRQRRVFRLEKQDGEWKLAGGSSQ
ncbi:MAG TPA: nuclear transport factor 2 family protein [Thermoleophilaceae bacterium]|nr:nuclear transport factor 2 family protein [Thermoleophilaceae bacterium]